MNERVVPLSRPVEGAESMQRLADRLTTLVPPAPAVPLIPELPKPSPAVAAALEKSAARAAEARRKAGRSALPLKTRLAEAFVLFCRYAVPYALAGLVLRLVMARVFFLDGQGRALGPQMSVELYGIDFSVVLPLQVKAQALAGYSTLSYLLSLPTNIVASVIGVAQFVLPLMLVVGFGTRFAAVLLVALTVALDLYVAPHLLWSAHVYWAALLLVLVSQGPGAISIDQILRSGWRR
jgi:putative oxidoreductase